MCFRNGKVVQGGLMLEPEQNYHVLFTLFYRHFTDVYGVADPLQAAEEYLEAFVKKTNLGDAMDAILRRHPPSDLVRPRGFQK